MNNHWQQDSAPVVCGSFKYDACSTTVTGSAASPTDPPVKDCTAEEAAQSVWMTSYFAATLRDCYDTPPSDSQIECCMTDFCNAPGNQTVPDTATEVLQVPASESILCYMSFNMTAQSPHWASLFAAANMPPLV